MNISALALLLQPEQHFKLAVAALQPRTVVFS